MWVRNDFHSWGASKFLHNFNSETVLETSSWRTTNEKKNKPCVRKTSGRLFPGLIVSSVGIVTKGINTPCSANRKLISLHSLHCLQLRVHGSSLNSL